MQIPEEKIKRALLMELYYDKDYSLTPKQAYEKVYEHFDDIIPDEDINQVHHAGQNQTKFENWVAWAREHLKEEGYILPPDISGRGVWKLSPKGIEKAKKFFVNDSDPHETIEEIVNRDIENLKIEEEVFEGKKKERLSNYYERKKENRNKAMELHGLKCAACEFNFEETYGELGKGFIEVHHLIPISSFDGEQVLTQKLI